MSNDVKIPEEVTLTLSNPRQLDKAENIDQGPAHIYSIKDDDPLALSKFDWVSGIPGYVGMADGSGVIEILCLIAESFRRWKGAMPYIVVAGKHGNPCGAAIDFDSPRNAICKALMGDTVAVMGGEVITNFTINEEYAQALFQPPTDIDIGRTNWGLDLVIAPRFSTKAISLLGKREKRKLLSNLALLDAPLSLEPWAYRQVRSSWLRQMAPNFALERNMILPWDGRQMSYTEFQNAIIAFACCWRASSNTVALANDNMLIGLGCGQQDRIACVRLALDRTNRAGHDTIGSIFASDAFFPYATSLAEWRGTDQIDLMSKIAHARDAMHFPGNYADAIQRLASLSAGISRADRREGPELLIAAGCAGGVVPADGNRLEEVKALFRESGLAMAFLPPEHRGFAKH